MTRILLAILFIGCGLVYAEQPGGKEILEKIDKNYEAKSRISTTSMIIKGRRGTRNIKAKSWAEGVDKTFTEYLAPARQAGIKMLKLKDELWTWSPSADRIIKIAGHMLKQSLLGSDVSYEDFMEDPVLSNSYNVKIVGEEKINDRLCYILELTATKDVSYYSRKLWVDKERYLPLKEDLFAKSGKLLKTFKITEVIQIGDRWYPKKMNFKDVLLDGDGTEIVIESIQFDVPIPETIFSKAALKR